MTTPMDTEETTVRKVVTVDAPIERAFAVFTTGFDTWWPRTHHIAEAEMTEAIIEGRAGRRWYERGVDGSECDWGTVLAFDAPNHLTLSWNLDGEFHYDPDPAHTSRVDVWFTAESPARTRVELAHSQLDHHGENWRQLRDGVASDGGWPVLIDGYAEAVAAG